MGDTYPSPASSPLCSLQPHGGCYPNTLALWIDHLNFSWLLPCIFLINRNATTLKGIHAHFIRCSLHGYPLTLKGIHAHFIPCSLHGYPLTLKGIHTHFIGCSLHGYLLDIPLTDSYFETLYECMCFIIPEGVSLTSYTLQCNYRWASTV